MSAIAEPHTGSPVPRPRAAIATRAKARVALALGLIAIGMGLAIVSLLGPLLTGIIDYHISETLRNQTIGLDAVSLLVVAPLSLMAALLVLRRHVAGSALAVGVGAYTSYMFVQYILGPEYERLPDHRHVRPRSFPAGVDRRLHWSRPRYALGAQGALRCRRLARPRRGGSHSNGDRHVRQRRPERIGR